MYIDIRIPKSRDIFTIIISDEGAMDNHAIAEMLRDVAKDLEKQAMPEAKTSEKAIDVKTGISEIPQAVLPANDTDNKK